MKTIVHTPTTRLSDSLDFYSKLGFSILSEKNPVLVSDGQSLIEINPDRHARAGLKLWKPDWTDAVRDLREVTTVVSTEDGHLLSDPSGTWIYLMDAGEGYDYPLSGLSASVLGNFAGLSLEIVATQRAIKVWETLGFEKKMGSIEQGWISLTNTDGLTISIMGPNSCPHLFFNPSMTYFNGKDNPAIIQKIRELGIPIAEEITVFNKEGRVDNIIIRDPGGYGFFVFND